MDQLLMLTVSPSANSTRGPSCHRLSGYVQLSRSGGRATIMRRCRQATCAHPYFPNSIDSLLSPLEQRWKKVKHVSISAPYLGHA